MNLLIPLFSPATGTWGGLTRVVAIANTAQQAGHQVAFCASGSLEDTLRERGFRVYSTPATTFLGLPGPLSRILGKRSQRATLPIRPGKSFGSIWLVLMISGMARSGYLRQLVQAERQAAQHFRADALFTDLDPGAFLLARLSELPIISAYQTIMRQGVGSFPWKLMNRATNAVLKANGCADLPVETLCFGPQVLKIIPSIPELEGEDPRRADVRYVGHLLGAIKPVRSGDFTPEPGKRYIFVYVGTGSVSLDSICQVLPRLLPPEGAVRAVVGAQSVTQVERIGALELRPYVSAEDLLPHCDWTICHGGQNTIIQSLLHGVPLIIFPGPVFERRFNASKVQEAGAGHFGELNTFSVDWLKQAMQDQAHCATNAAQLGASIRSYGGANTAREAIEGWVRISASQGQAE